MENKIKILKNFERKKNKRFRETFVKNKNYFKNLMIKKSSYQLNYR